MKKNILIALLLGAVGVGLVFSAPRNRPGVDKTSRNEGNTRSDIYVALSSQTWTSVLAASTRRRTAVLQTLSTASYLVCLSSHNYTAFSCSSTRAAIRLEPGGAYIDYNEAVLYGRIADEGSGVAIYGQEQYDSGDSASFQ